MTYGLVSIFEVLFLACGCAFEGVVNCYLVYFLLNSLVFRVNVKFVVAEVLWAHIVFNLVEATGYVDVFFREEDVG